MNYFATWIVIIIFKVFLQNTPGSIIPILMHMHMHINQHHNKEQILQAALQEGCVTQKDVKFLFHG